MRVLRPPFCGYAGVLAGPDPFRPDRTGPSVRHAGRTRWAPRPRVDNAMVRALARAFRWRKMLDEGAHATLEDLATTKDVHATYVSRVLRLTLLSPEIVEAILDGRQTAVLQLDDLLEGFPLEWAGQRFAVSRNDSPATITQPAQEGCSDAL